MGFTNRKEPHSIQSLRKIGNNNNKGLPFLSLSNLDKDENENAYENALLRLNLQSLEERRKELCLNFAKNCIKNGILSDHFKENKNKHEMKTRHPEKYEVSFANNDRMRKSSIVYMQQLLNEEHERQENGRKN